MKISKSNITIIGITWFLVVVLGMWGLLQYASFPGTSGNPPKKWINSNQIHSNPKLPTLVLFVHPHCPCTRATIGELSVIMTKCKNRVNVFVVFFKPKVFPTKWVKTDLWYSAKNISGVKVISDNDGNEIRHFKAATSGYTLLYNTNGDLIFSGGITRARGHSGDNPGRDGIISLINEGTTDIIKTPVFGCPLMTKKIKVMKHNKY